LTAVNVDAFLKHFSFEGRGTCVVKRLLAVPVPSLEKEEGSFHLINGSNKYVKEVDIVPV